MVATTTEPLTDHRAFDLLALSATRRVVAKVRDEHLNQPTPCAGWRVGDLLRHMVGNNRGFAATARRRTPDRFVWDGADLDSGTDLRHEWEGSAVAVTDAFAELTHRRDTLALPGYGDVPALGAVRMHFVDCLVHSWDLAVSIEVDPHVDDQACREVLRIAARWPQSSPEVWGPGAPFGAPVQVEPDAPVADRMLALLGRSPSWAVAERQDFRG